MKYYVIAGERSGDLHGGHLVKQLKEQDSEAIVRGWGGDEMVKAGLDLQRHYKETAIMGFWEVLKNLRKIRRFLRECKEDITNFQPDALILIDYPGFNLRMAAFAKKLSIPVHYYISPKVWAWNTKRAHKIRRVVDSLYIIFPFEKAFFRKYGIQAIYVGNPLVKSIKAYQPEISKEEFASGDRQIVAVLPGSREQEVKHMLGVMLEVADKMPSLHFVVAAVSNLPASLYEQAHQHPSVSVFTDQAYDVLSYSRAALVTSGTATLETALFNVPQIVCYKTSALTYHLAKRVIKIPYISLVNIVAEKEVVKELIQEEFNSDNIISHLQRLVEQTPARTDMIQSYKEIAESLGNKNAPQEVAEHVINSLR